MMPTLTIAKSWLLGVALLVVAHLLWWGVLAEVPFGEFLRMLLFVIPVVAAFAVTYLAPKLKLLLGMSMGLCGALLGFLAMAAYTGLGYHIDRVGGPLATFAVLLAYHLGYAFVGTAAGYLVWRARARSNSITPVI